MNRFLRKFNFLFHPLNYCVLAVDVVLILLLSVLGMRISIFAPVADAIKEFSTTDIYYQILKGEEPLSCDSIVLVDMTEIQSREELGGLLLEISSQQPAVIGVDVSFEGLKLDPEGSAFLKEAVAECPEAVFAYKLEDYDSTTESYNRVVHSFFAEELKVKEGYVNAATQSSNVQRFMRPIYEVNGQTHYSLAAAIVQKFRGKDAPKFIPNQLYPIDYTPTEFDVITPDSLALVGDRLKGRIVLIGGVTNYNDMHLSPLGKTAGVNIIAYSVRTLMDSPKVADDSIFSDSNIWQAVFCLIFVLFHCTLFRWSETLKYKSLKRLCTMSPTFLFEVSIATALMLGVSFYMFVAHSVVIELKWAAAMLTFTGPSLHLCLLAKDFYLDFFSPNRYSS